MTVVPGPERTARVATGGQDGTIRISAPVGEVRDGALSDLIARAHSI